MSVHRFELGDRVRFVGHADHVAPPVLEGMEDEAEGRVLARDVRDSDLYRIGVDGLRMPAIQVHVEQLERIVG